MIPKIEKIAERVLERIKTISPENGYRFALDVERDSGRNKRTHLKAIIHQADPDLLPTPGCGLTEWSQPFVIEMLINPSEHDTTPIDTYVNYLLADTQKAVMADAQWSGLCINTQIESPEFITDFEGRFDGIIFRFSVHYRTHETDPYEG